MNIQELSVGTSLARSTPTDIFLQDASLTKELMGNISFIELFIFQLTGKRPTQSQLNVVNAVLVSLMEHGMTPSSITARLIYNSSPEAMQGAVAAGLLGAGGVFLGSMENLGRLLQAGKQSIDEGITTVEEFARSTIERLIDSGESIPGFGHHIHRPDDPRTPKLFSIAEENGLGGNYIDLLTEMSRQLDVIKGKHITINTTGAVAAVLLNAGFPWHVLKGFSLLARTAGLVTHINEEIHRPMARGIWNLVEQALPDHN